MESSPSPSSSWDRLRIQTISDTKPERSKESHLLLHGLVTQTQKKKISERPPVLFCYHDNSPPSQPLTVSCGVGEGVCFTRVWPEVPANHRKKERKTVRSRQESWQGTFVVTKQRRLLFLKQKRKINLKKVGDSDGWVFLSDFKFTTFFIISFLSLSSFHT